jgi:hypothetical protein
MVAAPAPTVETLAVALKGLRDLLDERFAAQLEALRRSDTQVAAAQAAANEWRGAMNDLAARLLPRSEYDIHHADLADQLERLRKDSGQKLEDLTGRLATLEGKSSGIGYAVAIAISSGAMLVALIDIGQRMLH